jgi:peptidoglycan/LPS O-acetylase OafA/YrhL
LRGWGAVFVLAYHVFCDALPVGSSVAGLQYFVPFNGPLAVMVFFIVSGWSLSMRYLADGDVRSWTAILAGRYLRLAIPIFAACLIVHLVMTFGWVAPSNDRLPPFKTFFNFDPTVWHLTRFALVDVFFSYDASETYIGPLWSMSIELWGSFLVLIAILIARPLPGRMALLCVLAALILMFAPTETSAMLALFPIGAVAADSFNRGWIDRLPKETGIALLVLGVLTPILLPKSVMIWGPLSAVPLTVGGISVPRVRVWLSAPVSAYLGRISFPLYLIHGPVICFIGEPLMRHAGDGIALKVGVQFLVIVLSFGAARWFLGVNEFAIATSRRFAGFVISQFFAVPKAVG